jgi:hypothetical protein
MSRKKQAYRNKRPIDGKDEYSFRTQSEADYFLQQATINKAFHEAGHAVAAWMLGFATGSVPRGTLTGGKDLNGRMVGQSAEPFLFQDADGHILTAEKGLIKNKTGEVIWRIEDHGILARQRAYITLGGPISEIISGADLPAAVREIHFVEHCKEGSGQLSILGNPEKDNKHTLERLLKLAKYMFRQPRIEACVRALAVQIYAKRSLGKEEVQAIIDSVWTEPQIV